MKALYKIVHTSASEHWGDAEKRILDEALWMRTQGHQVVVIAPPTSPLLAKSRANGFPFYAVSFRGLGLGSRLQQLREILANEQPHILNAHGRTDGRLSIKAAKKAGVPCRIISRHNGTLLRNSWQNRLLYKKLSHYIFTSSTHHTRLLKKTFNLSEMQIFAIPGGIVMPDHLLAPDAAAQKLAGTLQLEPGIPLIGLLDPWDLREISPGTFQLLKAFKRMQREIPHHLVIPATDETAPVLSQTLAKQSLSDRVHVMPPQDPWLYCRALACGIHVPAPGQEQVPRAMLEAMHASCPVVSGKTDEILEVVAHGKTALLWDTTEQLVHGVMDTLARPAATRERVLDARELVRKTRSIDAMGRDIIRIYRLHQVKLERRYHQVDPELFY